MKRMIHSASRMMALVLVFIMVFGVATSERRVEVAAQESRHVTASPASVTAGSNYRNLSLNPGANNAEMRFTWHSGSPTGSIVITAPNGDTWVLVSSSRPAEAHMGVGAMGVTSNMQPTRPGFRYYVHQVSVYDLPHDTTLTYIVTWDGGQSDLKTFRTGGSDNFQFIIAGDPQIGTGDGLQPIGTADATVDGRQWANALDIAVAAYPRSDFVLALGDQVQTSSYIAGANHVSIAQYRHDRMFSPQRLQSLPIMGVVGNHDGWSFDDNNANIRLWPMHYNIPAPDNVGEIGGYNQNVFRHRGDFYTQFDYWVRWGNVLFIVLDSNGANAGIERVMSGERLEFLEDAVAQNLDAEWRVATFHHPAYSVYRITGIPEKTQIINNFLPHFERLDFDIVLTGHAHVYNRTHQMLANVPQLHQNWLDASANIVPGTEATNAVLDPTGLVHITFNSASGSGFYNVAQMPRSYVSFYNQNFRRNFSVVDVTPYTFSVRTYQINNDESHTLLDVYTIVRSDASGGVPGAVTSLPQMGEQIFERITTPEDMVVPNPGLGVVPTAEAFRLPETVGIETNLFNNVGGNLANLRPPNAQAAPYYYGTVVRTPRGPVVWDMDSLGFDPYNEFTQRLTVTGTVSLPANIGNPNGIPLTVEMNVLVMRYGVVEPGAIARWMQGDGMETYFVGHGGINARRPAVPTTYGTVIEPLQFFVGNTPRMLQWNAGAPTITTGTVPNSGSAIDGVTGGLHNLDLDTDQPRWQTTISTTGRAGIQVEFDMRSDPGGTGNNNNGPRDWQLQFSLDGITWQDAGAPIVMGGTWNPTHLRTLPETANDQDILYIRWLMTSNIAVGGGAISATARHHMRNITIRSTIPLLPDCECRDDGLCSDGNCLVCRCCQCPPSADCSDNGCGNCLNCFCNEPLRIDVLMFNDFHGHVEFAEPVDENPGAARLVAYIEYQRSQNHNPNNVIVVGGGDEFHGYAVSTLTQGNPVISMMEYLASNSPAQQDSGIHVAFGNHEFSFGYNRATQIGHDPSVTLLAADLFYGHGHPMAGQRPSFVRPYDIIEFPDHDITIALVGLMTSNMHTVVGGWGTLGLENRTPSPGSPTAYRHAINDLVTYLRDERGVGAVIGVTHKGGNSASMTYIATHIDFDAIVGGHVHVRVQREVNGTPIIEAQHHGRAMGRFSLFFDDNGELESVDAWLSPPGAIAEFNRSAAVVAGVGHHYDAMTAIISPYLADTFDELRGPRGPHGIYFSNRTERDVWSSRLVLDYVVRWAEAHGEPTDWIGVSNSGGWRNTGFWPRSADDPTNFAELLSTMPFDNAMMLFEMHGQDVHTMLNSTGLGGGSSIVMAGVHRVGDDWYVTATEERITNDRSRIYNVIAANSIFGGRNVTGIDNFPLPGNNRGNALGMEFISYPRAIMQDGSTMGWIELNAMSESNAEWENFGVSMVRTALLASTEFRGITPASQWQAELLVSSTVGGTAVITSPFAPNDRSRNMNIIPQWVIVTANPNPGYQFVGWFNTGDPANADPLSESAVYGFAIRENTSLEARFEVDEGEPITVTEANALPGNTAVRVRGVVTATYLPGTSGSGLFIQDPDTVPIESGAEASRGILVRLPVSSAAVLDPFVGQLVDVIGTRDGNVAGNGFVNVPNVTAVGTIAVRVIEPATIPAPVQVTLQELSTRDFQSMLVSILDPVQIASVTTGAGGDPNRNLADPATGDVLAFDASGNIVENVNAVNAVTSFIVWPDPVGRIPAGQQGELNRAIVHFWDARTEIQLRLLNPVADLTPVVPSTVISIADARAEAGTGTQVTIEGRVTGTLTASAAFVQALNADANTPNAGVIVQMTAAGTHVGQHIRVTGYVRNVGGNLRLHATNTDGTGAGNNIVPYIVNSSVTALAPIPITIAQAATGFDGMHVTIINPVTIEARNPLNTLQNHELAGTAVHLRINLGFPAAAGFGTAVQNGTSLYIRRGHLAYTDAVRHVYSSSFNEPATITMTGINNASRIEILPSSISEPIIPSPVVTPAALAITGINTGIGSVNIGSTNIRHAPSAIVSGNPRIINVPVNRSHRLTIVFSEPIVQRDGTVSVSGGTRYLSSSPTWTNDRTAVLTLASLAHGTTFTLTLADFVGLSGNTLRHSHTFRTAHPSPDLDNDSGSDSDDEPRPVSHSTQVQTPPPPQPATSEDNHSQILSQLENRGEEDEHLYVLIAMPKDTTYVYIGLNTIDLLVNEAIGLVVSQGYSTVAFPSELFVELQVLLDEDSVVVIAIDILTPTSAVGMLNVMAVVNVSIHLDGVAITDYVSGTLIEILVDFSEIDIGTLNPYRLIALNNLGIVGGVFDPELNAFILTTHLGNYSIAYIPNLNRVVMQIGSNQIHDLAQDTNMLMDVSPIIAYDRTLLPIRFLAESLGGDVSWNGETQTVSITMGNDQLSFVIGELENGMDVPAVIFNDRTFVPIRFVAETFGALVVWEEETSTISIIYIG
ncbi:MAG: stalk domain-containing protein [Defluviitaleaceae bacterium]|nr:stalk domain-containing protein [Defluviitaleaceae bacterium]